MFIEERVIRIINLNGWKSKRQYNNAVSTEAVPGHLSIQKTKKNIHKICYHVIFPKRSW